MGSDGWSHKYEVEVMDWGGAWIWVRVSGVGCLGRWVAGVGMVGVRDWVGRGRSVVGLW